MNTKRHFIHGNIAGFTYWDGAEAFSKLTIGTMLTLQREENNQFDPYAVAVYFEEYKLGFIPRNQNKEVAKFLEMGYEDIFEVRINRISPEEHPENQIGMIVHLKGKEQKTI